MGLKNRYGYVWGEKIGGHVTTCSIEVVNFLMRGSSYDHPFRDIIEDVKLLVVWE